MENWKLGEAAICVNPLRYAILKNPEISTCPHRSAMG